MDHGEGLAFSRIGRVGMNSQRWDRVNALFHSAVEHAPEKRAAFLEAECGSDESLCREIKSLLRSHERTQNFIELPAFEAVPELLVRHSADELIGELIGRYRIERLIDVGGMGEVYLARDEQLGRKAALKLLPQHLMTDQMQVSRFKSEASSASALNHPNILTVYEIGTEGTRHYIAMEFIEGSNLRVLLAGERMELPTVLEIARQVG